MMLNDIINQTLKTYYVQRGKAVGVIKRYLGIKYRIFMDEESLKRRIEHLSTT